MTNRDWLAISRRTSAPAVRLVCLPHAGGGTTVFHPWTKELPPYIEVCSVRLPGRESRHFEPLRGNASSIVWELADVLLTLPPAPSLAIFGHSMGALLAFELAHALADRRLRTDLLVVSGRRAPHRHSGTTERRHLLPDDELLEVLLERYGGIPKEVLDDRELMAMFLPILRADLKVVETYRFTPRSQGDWPLMVYGGIGDRSVGREDLLEWQQLTRGPFRLEMMPGDHFFLQTNRAAFLERLVDDIRTWCTSPAQTIRP
ncbi:MAG TPA: alpha/beta fold hydrolase [Thermoanaerobaculia bacterium]|nr:alpha/beta fold hydrolase [Thermoanaerobaculia bacterium]